jgi:hypothetical protein
MLIIIVIIFLKEIEKCARFLEVLKAIQQANAWPIESVKLYIIKWVKDEGFRMMNMTVE